MLRTRPRPRLPPHLAALIRASLLIAIGLPDIRSAEPGPDLSVDVGADRHPISPAIYGTAYPDPAFAREIRCPMQRWGGDATTRYNWQADASNCGDDWFFMSGSDPKGAPSAGPDAMIAAAKANGGQALITVPIIDWICRSNDVDCSYPVSLVGPQQKLNPYVHPLVGGRQTDAGNGRTADGQPITLTTEQIARINRPNSPELQRGWIEHLVRTFGTTGQGGVAIYELDNEPGGWCNTHRDVHPDHTGHDELVSRSIAYAAMIKQVDPSAKIAGPGDFVMHYQADGRPGDGMKEHEGLGQASYYLRKFAEYEKLHGVRLLDYFDEHYYPAEQDGLTEEESILDATRSFWDPTYVEKNWIGKWAGGAKMLIPKFRAWVDAEYPGTKLSISEYCHGDPKTVTGTLSMADVLGIFGREHLDMACMFGSPKPTDPGANAFRIYRDYDGRGSGYGDTWVRSASADQSRLSIYGAQRSADRAVTIVIINKSKRDLASHVGVRGIDAAPAAGLFRFSAATPTAIVREADLALGPDGFQAVFPARSITLVVIAPK
jgi:hypothetical protein